MIKLSERLLAVASLVTPGSRVVDMGCDHGHLAIYLIEKGLVPSVIATDINIGPISRAEENIDDHDLSGDIEIRLSDGLKMIEPGEADSVVMAGMGGNLMIEILIRDSDVAGSIREFIFQPQSETAKLRHYLQDAGFRIVSEVMVLEDEKYYPMIKAVHGEMAWDREIYFIYGKILLREKDPVLHQFLIEEKNHYTSLYRDLTCFDPTFNVRDRMKEIGDILHYNEEALEIMNSINPVEIDRKIR